jgi:hypothetical protein
MNSLPTCACDGDWHYVRSPGHPCDIARPPDPWLADIIYDDAGGYWQHGNYTPPPQAVQDFERNWRAATEPNAIATHWCTCRENGYHQRGATLACDYYPDRSADLDIYENEPPEPTAEEKAQQVKDGIYRDLYPGGLPCLDSWHAWRREYERTGAQYALDRMREYDVPSELTMFDKDYKWPAPRVEPADLGVAEPRSVKATYATIGVTIAIAYAVMLVLSLMGMI